MKSVKIVAMLCPVLLTGGLVTAGASAEDRVYYSNQSPDGAVSYVDLGGSGGGTVDLGSAPGTNPAGVTLDPAHGRLYFIDFAHESVGWVALDGGGRGDLDTTGATIDDPKGIVYDPGSERVYWANGEGPARISYAVVDGSGGGDLDTTGATGTGPHGLAIDPGAGRVYWTDVDAWHISYADLDGSGGGDLVLPGATFDLPVGIALDPATGLVYWANLLGDSIGFSRVDGSGGSGLLDTTGATVNWPQGIAIDPDTHRIYWGNSGGGSGPAPLSYARLDGSGGGDLDAAGTAANSAPMLPVLLKEPAATGEALVAGVDVAGHQLTCATAWKQDSPERQLYRSPTTVTYTWQQDDADLPGATSRTFTPAVQGSYGCRATAANAAGSVTISVPALVVHEAPPAAPPTTPTTPVAPAGLAGPPALAAPTRLTLTGLSLSPGRFRAGARAGTTISFDLSGAAQVRFRIRSRSHGGPDGAPVLQQRFVRELGAGHQRVRFTGTMAHHVVLAPGSYTLYVQARTAGSTSTTSRATFTVLR
jgi:hypothetical protein